MISKKEVLFGTYTELETYCNSIILPAAERLINPKIGDKYYMPNSEFKTVVKNTPELYLLPYLEVRELNANIEPEISFDLKTMILKVNTISA